LFNGWVIEQIRHSLGYVCLEEPKESGFLAEEIRIQNGYL